MADEDVNVLVEEAPLEKEVKEVIKLSMGANGLVKGLREVVKSLVLGKAQLVILAKDCSEEAYKKLIRALCDQQAVYMIEVAKRQDLGRMVGLFQSDANGDPKEGKKIVSCSAVCITEFGEDSDALRRLKENFNA